MDYRKQCAGDSMKLKRGDLLLNKSSSYVFPGGRYSQGLVLSDPCPGFHTVYVAWRDGMITEESEHYLLSNYVRITNENG